MAPSQPMLAHNAVAVEDLDWRNWLIVLRTLAIAVFCIILLVAGQTLLKVGLLRIGGTSFLSGPLLQNVAKLFATPYIVLGFVVYGVSAILWLDVLSRLDFSVAFPLVSLTYIFALVIGSVLFHEQVGWSRIMGVFLICGGLVFIVKSA
jgi:drug/metabolite transporter (DMT)-like permease